MSAEKRPADDDPGASQSLVKRQNVNTSEAALARLNASGSSLVKSATRTSGLQSPVMELTGHSGEIFTARFDPTGDLIASGSMDRTIMLWKTYGDCDNYGLFKGHKGAILDLQWSRDSEILYSASADMHVASWDLTSGARIRRYVGHEEIINAVNVSQRGGEVVVSGSDDSTIGIWDPRSKNAVDYIQTDFPITALAVSRAGTEIVSGGIDNDIRVWDLRKKSVIYSMLGHTDTITSLRVSPDMQSLVSYAMDSTVRTWDIRSFAPTERLIRTFDGAAAGLEQNLMGASWSADGKRIAAGSGDGTVVVWSSETGKLLYKLPGHRGMVNSAELSPGKEPIREHALLPRAAQICDRGSRKLTRAQSFLRRLIARCFWVSSNDGGSTLPQRARSNAAFVLFFPLWHSTRVVGFCAKVLCSSTRPLRDLGSFEGRARAM